MAIGKETGRRLGMGTNMYPSSALLGQHKDESVGALPIDDLIEKADGFAGVFPGKICLLMLLKKVIQQLNSIGNLTISLENGLQSINMRL